MNLDFKLEQQRSQLITANIIAMKAKHMASLDAEMNVVAKHMYDNTVAGTPVDEGDLRDAWVGPIKKEWGHYRVENPLPYAVIVEKGGYPGVGPKTHQAGGQILPGGIRIRGGIYPIQKPEAMLARAMSRAYLEMRDAVRHAAKAIK